MPKLNPTQQEAVTHTKGPLLVIAGAGSGKTRIVAFRIVHLIDSGVPPSEILAVTFTNKAAGEMQERIHQLLPLRYAYPTICTFHSLGVRILRESIQHLGYHTNFLIYDDEDSNKLLKGCLQTLNIPHEANQIKMCRSLISAAKNQLQAPSDFHPNDLPHSLQKTFLPIYSLYQQRLKEANAVDFDDLLYLTVRLFQNCPDILEIYRRRWSYLLIDEYQDTNHSQYLLAKFLVEKTNNIFVVGDPDQSIYSWRGANIQNILNFEQDYPGAKVVRLEQNYRSRENILDAANALIAHNSSRYQKKLWSDKGIGEMIVLHIGATEKDETYFIVNEIERLHSFHQIPFKDMAIFYRTNFQSRVFEDFLLRKRIPYVIVGGISFYHRKEIKDLLAFLRMVSSDHDSISLERTINLPKRGIGPTTIEKIRTGSSENQVPILQYCDQILSGTTDVRLSGKQREGLLEYVHLIKSLRLFRAEHPLFKLVLETIRQSNYLDVLREDKETFDDRKQNLDELVSKAHEWEETGGENTLEHFLEELSLKSSLDEADLSDDKLNLMTIHNGKGLEFHAVFLVGMEEDLFPHANSRDNYEALEEERRLCYVGMTRAKERLYLSAAEVRLIWGSYRTMRPSRFLREIPREFLIRSRG